MTNNRLDKEFFNRSAVEVAKDLIGKFLITNFNGQRVVGQIVETEAYWGEDDLACHASRGRTKRTETLFGEPAHLYVYLNYGIFYLTNVVCGEKDKPEAVLLRSVEIFEGHEFAKHRIQISKFVQANEFMATGPGKLSIAFGLTGKYNNLDATGSEKVYFERMPEANRDEIVSAKRIGVDYAKHCKDYLWRFFINKNKYVSKPKG